MNSAVGEIFHFYTKDTSKTSSIEVDHVLKVVDDIDLDMFWFPITTFKNVSATFVFTFIHS